jgi:hypothetical protein
MPLNERDGPIERDILFTYRDYCLQTNSIKNFVWVNGEGDRILPYDALAEDALDGHQIHIEAKGRDGERNNRPGRLGWTFAGLCKCGGPGIDHTKDELFTFPDPRYINRFRGTDGYKLDYYFSFLTPKMQENPDYLESLNNGNTSLSYFIKPPHWRLFARRSEDGSITFVNKLRDQVAHLDDDERAELGL